jgi:hypothetical protein
MRYSVCVIDNDIPASGAQAQAHAIDDSRLLNASNLQLLLQRAEWDDEVIRNLISTLLEQKDEDGFSRKWDVCGFTNPAFYINAINDGFFRSDVIVFDWEYPGAQTGPETNSESILREILERTFCLIFIFSKADKKDEIEGILEKEEFRPYKERLQYLDKAVAGVDQTNVLLQRSDEMYGQNFSFKFAGVLRRQSVLCADRILSDMGRASLNDVKNLLLVGDGGKKDLVDFLAERFRTTIAGRQIYDLIERIPAPAVGAPAPAQALAAGVWSYRLYFQQETGDDLVRRGDVVKVGEAFFLVLSADCDLGYFWKKNLGIINAISLHELRPTNGTLKDWLTLCVKPEKLSKKIGSLLGQVGELSEGPFVLPFVPADGDLKNFIAIPKDLTSTRIPTPPGWSDFSYTEKKAHPMKYPYWKGAQRICTISEPFLTPVIQHVLNTLGGNGVPDYPDHLKDVLKRILDDFGATPPSSAAQAATAPATPAPLARQLAQDAAVPALPISAEDPPAAAAAAALAAAQPPEADGTVLAPRIAILDPPAAGGAAAPEPPPEAAV